MSESKRVFCSSPGDGDERFDPCASGRKSWDSGEVRRTEVYGVFSLIDPHFNDSPDFLAHAFSRSISSRLFGRVAEQVKVRGSFRAWLCKPTQHRLKNDSRSTLCTGGLVEGGAAIDEQSHCTWEDILV